MGYLSTAALHIKGSKSKIKEVQRDYFNDLDNSPVNLWSDEILFHQVETLHETKEKYVDCGKYIWKELAFTPQGDDMYGELFWANTKWLRYFEHQCNILLNVCTKHSYSWYYLHIGERDSEIIIKNNAHEIEDFNEDVFKPYIIDHYSTTPILVKSKPESAKKTG